MEEDLGQWEEAIISYLLTFRVLFISFTVKATIDKNQ
jgi:hypothetical protein